MIWELLPIVALSGCSGLGNSPAAPQVDPVEVVRVGGAALPFTIRLCRIALRRCQSNGQSLLPLQMQEYLDDLNEGSAPSNAFYGLTSKGYRIFSWWLMAEVKRYIRQALSIIEYYRKLDKEDSDEQSDRDAEVP